MEKQLTMHANNWWLQILLGILFIGFGLWLWFTPAETYITLAVFFSVWMFVSGIFEIINAFGAKNHSAQWQVYLIGGLIDIVLGGILMAHENLTMEILPLFLGFWLLFRAIMLLVMFYELKKSLKGASTILLLSAILSGIFALIILAKPIVGELTIVYSTAFAFFFIGIYKIILGNNLHRKG